MKNLIFIISAFVLVASCSKSNNEITSNEFKYRVIIYDTLQVEALSTALSPIGYIKNRILFVNQVSPDTIFQTDWSGRLISKFSIAGGEPSKVGPRVYGVDYLGDTVIVAIGVKGVYYYDLNGKLISKKDLESIYRAGSVSYTNRMRVRPYQKDKQTYLVACWIPPITAEKADEFYSIQEKFLQHKGLTNYNTQANTYSLEVPIEEGTIFRNKNEKYNLEISFDVNNSENLLYVLNNPHQEIFVYDISVSPFKLVNRIPLVTKFFTLRLKQKFSEKNWDSKDFYLNAYFKSLDLSDTKKECLVTYRTSMTEDEYKQVPSNAVLAETFMSRTNLYGILLENDKQIGEEFAFPKNVDNVFLFKNKDTILLTTQNYEPEKTTAFYVARLEKIR